MIKILIADDHAVVRSGLSMLLSAKPQFKVVGERQRVERLYKRLRNLSRTLS